MKRPLFGLRARVLMGPALKTLTSLQKAAAVAALTASTPPPLNSSYHVHLIVMDEPRDFAHHLREMILCNSLELS